MIGAVGKNTPAAEAGFKPVGAKGEVGDVIVAVNGRPVPTLSTFSAEIDRVGIDNTAELSVVRDGRERKVRVKVIDLAR